MLLALELKQTNKTSCGVQISEKSKQQKTSYQTPSLRSLIVRRQDSQTVGSLNFSGLWSLDVTKVALKERKEKNRREITCVGGN